MGLMERINRQNTSRTKDGTISKAESVNDGEFIRIEKLRLHLYLSRRFPTNTQRLQRLSTSSKVGR